MSIQDKVMDKMMLWDERTPPLTSGTKNKRAFLFWCTENPFVYNYCENDEKTNRRRKLTKSLLETDDILRNRNKLG